ncbi:MAG: efflux RND transporter periplasmic adaptor subunit [Planctomycetota bacterium]
MHRDSLLPPLGILLSLGFAVGCGGPANGSAMAQSLEENSLEPVSITVFTDKIELYMEYPRLQSGVPARFLAHVTVLATGEPVRDGKLRLEAVAPDDNVITLHADRPTRDGLFIPVGALEKPGSYGARIVVQSTQVSDTVELGELLVHPDMESARSAAAAEDHEEPPDAVPFPLEQQWKIGMRMEKVTSRRLVERLHVLGQIEAAQGRSAAVTSTVDGRLLPGQSGRLPGLGDHVQAGEILAMIEPPLPATAASQLQADRAAMLSVRAQLLVHAVDLQARSLEIEQAVEQAQVHIAHAQRVFERISGLSEKGLRNQGELEQAQRDLRLAEIERDKAISLRRFNASIAAQIAPLTSFDDLAKETAREELPLRLPLVAPISGEIVEAPYVEGENVDPGGVAYRILDSGMVWLQSRVSEFDLAALESSPDALVTLPAYPDKVISIRESGGRLVHIGRAVDPQSRTVPVRFELPNADGLLRIGLMADVSLETKGSQEAVALPEESIVQDSGRPIAFVVLGGETLQKRELVLGIRDGGHVEVKDGIVEGERVVTRGAYLVKLAAASPASFGEGHVH